MQKMANNSPQRQNVADTYRSDNYGNDSDDRHDVDEGGLGQDQEPPLPEK